MQNVDHSHHCLAPGFRWGRRLLRLQQVGLTRRRRHRVGHNPCHRAGVLPAGSLQLALEHHTRSVQCRSSSLPRRKAMHIAVRNALTLGWHDLRLFLIDFTVSGAVWLLVGFFAAIAALSVLAMQATLALHAPHRRLFRAGWAPEIAKSTISEIPVQDLMIRRPP